MAIDLFSLSTHQKGSSMSDDSTKPAVDLLSGDGSEEEAAVPPASADAAKFSIDDDEDIDKLEGKIDQDTRNENCSMNENCYVDIPSLISYT